MRLLYCYSLRSSAPSSLNLQVVSELSLTESSVAGSSRHCRLQSNRLYANSDQWFAPLVICTYTPPRRWSRRSSLVALTTATHCCRTLTTGYFAECSRYTECCCRQHTWSSALASVWSHFILLRQLHWLSVRQRVYFKILGLAHQSSWSYASLPCW